MKIIISGEGGQGVQIVSEVLARVAEKMGKHTSYMPSFGVEQRGGASRAFLQFSEQKITYPKFPQADIIIVMSDRAVEATEDALTEETIFIFDSSNVSDEVLAKVRPKVTKFLGIGAREYANRNLSTKVTNMIFLGVLLFYLPDFKVDDVKAALKEKLTEKPEYLEMDLKAIDWGYDFAKSGQGQEFKGEPQKEVQKKFDDDQKTWERFPEYCKGCALCIVRCPVHALRFSEDLNFMGTRAPIVDINKCEACLTCQLTCPDGAIKVVKKN